MLYQTTNSHVVQLACQNYLCVPGSEFGQWLSAQSVSSWGNKELHQRKDARYYVIINGSRVDFVPFFFLWLFYYSDPFSHLVLHRTNLELHPFEKVFPQSPSGARGWSDTSDVLSTQGSGSYYEEYVPSPGYEQ